MKIIEFVARDQNDPLYGFGRETHMLMSISIDDNNPLRERFNDTRTPYEQYCAGEKYLRYDDETLYSRTAHEFIFNESRNLMFPKKNFKMRVTYSEQN